jgi:hypothetical protein
MKGHIDRTFDVVEYRADLLKRAVRLRQHAVQYSHDAIGESIGEGLEKYADKLEVLARHLFTPCPRR